MKSVNYKLELQSGIYVFDERISISEAVDKANLARRSLKTYQSSDIAFYSSDLMDGQKRETELIQDFKSALKITSFLYSSSPSATTHRIRWWERKRW